MNYEQFLAVTRELIEKDHNFASRINDLLLRIDNPSFWEEDTSFCGERVAIERLTKDLEIENGFVLDIAASDGVSQSSTLGLFANQNWKGLAVEMDKKNFLSLLRGTQSLPVQD